MTFVRELEVWGYPGVRMTSNECDELIKLVANQVGLPKDVLIPYHSTPSRTDVDNLLIGLSEHELTHEDFMRFCSEQGILADPINTKAANDFLTFWYGQKFAWLHLPEEFNNDFYIAQLSQKLKQLCCSLIDPDSLVCLIQQ